MKKSYVYRTLFFLLLFLLVLLSGCSLNNRCPESYLDMMEETYVVIDGDRVIILDTVAIYFRADNNCYDGALCEDEDWIIYKYSTGCEVAYEITVSGDKIIIPAFYIDLDSKKIFAANDNKDDYAVMGGVELFNRSNIQLPEN